MFERYAFRTDWPQGRVRMMRVRDWVLKKESCSVENSIARGRRMVCF